MLFKDDIWAYHRIIRIPYTFLNKDIIICSNSLSEYVMTWIYVLNLFRVI